MKYIFIWYAFSIVDDNLFFYMSGPTLFFFYFNRKRYTQYYYRIEVADQNGEHKVHGSMHVRNTTAIIMS
jgi:hypothetical protein